MSDTFGHEVDFLAVGGSSKSGDAICIRWGEELSSRHDRQFVMVVNTSYHFHLQFLHIYFLHDYRYHKRSKPALLLLMGDNLVHR